MADGYFLHPLNSSAISMGGRVAVSAGSQAFCSVLGPSSTFGSQKSLMTQHFLFIVMAGDIFISQAVEIFFGGNRFFM